MSCVGSSPTRSVKSVKTIFKNLKERSLLVINFTLSYLEDYPSLVKGAVLKTARSATARGFESHIFLAKRILHISYVYPLGSTI